MIDDEVLVGKRSVGLLRRLLGENGFPDPDQVVAALQERLSPPPPSSG
jgi:hypothetical protein